MQKISLYLIILLLLPGIVFASSFEQAKNYYQQAIDVDELSEKAELLEKSIDCCPTFNAWYMLGKVYQKQGINNKALGALEKAELLSSNEKAYSLILGRLGQIHCEQGNLADAASDLKEAIDLHPNPPDWMNRALQRVEEKKGTCVAAKDIVAEMERSLCSARSLEEKGFEARPSIDLRILFEYDSAELNSQGRRQVEELAQALSDSKFKGYDFTLIGHTDKRGPEAYNMQLSKQRARTVKQAVSQLNTDLSSRLQFEGKGESELRFPGSSEKVHRLNRRVEVRIE